MRATFRIALRLTWVVAGLMAAAPLPGCPDDVGNKGPNRAADIHEGACVQQGASQPDSLPTIGCRADFDALASEPLDTSIPGARSVKVVLDQLDDDALHFQNSTKYRVHYEFAAENLSVQEGLPLVSSLSEFNQTEYSVPDRRFILGAVTYYEGPGAFVLEIAPYDKAPAEMIEKLYRAVAKAAYFGPALAFHPTSQAVEIESAKLPDDILTISTDELYAKIDYQPLNLGTTIGQLRFAKADELDTVYLGFRDVVVLDRAPNDISVVSGLITEEFQTPLSHVNVLSQNRKTPNMGLRNASANPALRALEGKWVKLVVGAFEYSVSEVSQAEADAFWEANKPTAVQVPNLDTSVTDLRNIEDVVEEKPGTKLADSIRAAIPAFGGKASHYSILAKTDGANAPKAFAIPVYYYDQFMQQNGFRARVDDLLADPAFVNDAAVRDAKLAELRAAIQEAPLDAAFESALMAKLAADYPHTSVRFRSSTNAEDLEGFTGAGLYTSKTGKADDWDDVLAAIREVWSSVWYFRAFEERSYRSIDHQKVAMALLVHHSFPDEEANGVALTANPFDPSGLEPGFYVNVQAGDASVVAPDPATTTDQFIYQYASQEPALTYLTHSSLVPEGQTVLTARQVFELGQGLAAVHKRFSAAYGPAAGNDGWYAMDVEFKFDGAPGETPVLAIKQARPHPGRGD